MADVSIANLPAFVGAGGDVADLLAMVDVSDTTESPLGTTKKLTLSQVWTANGNLTGSPYVIAVAAAGTFKGFRMQNPAGINRWYWGTDGVAESGGNAGANLLLQSYNDAGGSLTVALQVDRATSAAAFAGPVTAADFVVNGDAQASQGSINFNSTYGIFFRLRAGSSYDYALMNPAATAFVLTVPTGTQRVDFTGMLGINVPSSVSIYLNIGGAAFNTTGVQQAGIQCRPTFNATATSTARAIDVQVATQAAGFNVSEGSGLHVNGPNIGAGSGFTTMYGLYVENQTHANIVTAYAIFTNGGRIRFGGLPTSAAGLAAGTLWNNAGVVNVA